MFSRVRCAICHQRDKISGRRGYGNKRRDKKHSAQNKNFSSFTVYPLNSNKKMGKMTIFLNYYFAFY